MTNEQPEQWAVELWRMAVFDYGGASIEDTPAEWRAVMTIQRAFAEREADLVGALTNTCAHLAAAISLLERGGKAAKKAAPSDRMFDQMVKDYKASLDRARTALAAYRGEA